MSKVEWHVLTTTPDVASAQALVEFLLAQGITSRVVPDSTILGQAFTCRVVVDAAVADQAQRVMSQGQFTEEELAFLATGVTSCDAAKE